MASEAGVEAVVFGAPPVPLSFLRRNGRPDSTGWYDVPLVREVVASIYSESHREPTDLIGDGEAVQTLAACRYAAEVVAARSPVEDAAAYRAWLRHIAAVVTGVAQGVVAAEAPGRVGLAESRFLYALGGVLRP